MASVSHGGSARSKSNLEVAALLNLRDLGGLRTENGRRIRSRLVYRSATPQFIDSMQASALVHGLQIKTRVDLRSKEEIIESPNLELTAQAMIVAHLPFRAGGAYHGHTHADPHARVAEHYLQYLRNSADSVTGVVRLLSNSQSLPALVHCTAGKDRTGVAIAVVMSALGVKSADVVADYARTREQLDLVLAQLRTVPAYLRRMAVLPAESLTAEPRTMEIFLTRLAEDFGGARGYLRSQGVGYEVIEALQESLLMPSKDSDRQLREY